MQKLFDKFIDEKRYIEGLSENTLRSYRISFDRFKLLEGALNSEGLDNFVVGLRKAGVSAGGCNVKIRSINSFLSWCYRKGHCDDLKIKLLKSNSVVPYQLTEPQVRTLVLHKPKKPTEIRLHALVLLCLDTGIRIMEGLTLKRKEVDFDNLLITVTGKGNKQRVIPFSLELRKVLYKLLQGHSFDLVFCTRHGLKLNYRNIKRDLKTLTERLGIKCGFHDFRRFFITNAIKQGINPIIVQRLAGHSSFMVTQRYIYLITDDLSRAHTGTSAIARYR